jgi:hypothetical protein
MAIMGKKTEGKKTIEVDTVGDDDVDSDTRENPDEDFRWLESTLKDKERSRIQRQMKARRELERRRDEKHLRALIDDDWLMDSVH